MTHLATFAAGCFWGTEETFRRLTGVVSTIVGYTGGKRPNPTYEQVCSNATGHAEAIKIEFDPKVISYEKLLDVFWENHNPTTKDRDGPNIGSQYRSVIFYHSDKQKRLAEVSKAELDKSGKWRSTIVTEILPSQPFYPAEEYHQKYYAKRGGGSCRM